MNIKRIPLPLQFVIVFLSIILFAGCASTTGVSDSEKDSDKSSEINPGTIELNNDLKERGYISKTSIKEIDKIRFDYDDNGSLINRNFLSTQIYDGNGYLTETIIYDKEKEIKYRYLYEYDVSGRRAETIRYLSNGIPDKRYTYEYNKFGNKIRSERFDMSGTLEKYYLYNYDEKQNLTNEFWYDVSDEVEFVITYEYDKSGRKLKAVSRDPETGFKFTYEYKYNKAGNIVEEVRYDANGKADGIIQYLYKLY